MREWAKYPNEKLLVGVRWGAALDGATPDGNPVPTIVGSTSLAAEFVDWVDLISLFWLTGGDQGVTGQRVSFALDTDEGEILVTSVAVTMLRN